MGTKLHELRDGCFARAMDDEPMLVLLARDLSAPDLAEDWANRREADVTAGRKPASDLGQVEEVRDLAGQMREWREANDGAWRNGLFANEAATEDWQDKNGLSADERPEGPMQRADMGNGVVQEHVPAHGTADRYALD
jgi:hypothetical protein